MHDKVSRQSDAALIERVQAGELDCFTELIVRYRSALVRVAVSRLGRSDCAEDVAQETLMRAFRSRDTFNPHYSFRTWLWTIAINVCRQQWSKHQRTPRIETWSDAASDSTEPALLQASLNRGDASPVSQLIARERAELLHRLLQRLPGTQADALRLRFFGELKYQEIADTMGCSLGTAKNRVAAGLRQLAEWLQPQAVDQTGFTDDRESDGRESDDRESKKSRNCDRNKGVGR